MTFCLSYYDVGAACTVVFCIYVFPCPLWQNPGSPLGATYAFLDESATGGSTYFYWLEDVDIQGAATLHGPVSVEARPLRRLLPARPRLAPSRSSLEAR